MNVIKRSGEEVKFDLDKIITAISKANAECDENQQVSYEVIKLMAQNIFYKLERLNRAVDVEYIQNLVEETLIRHRLVELAQRYIRYRWEHNLTRGKNTLEKRILTLVDNKSEDILQENANKNPIVASTQRDYMAGEVSKDISRRFLLPDDILKAHDAGIIHFHDMDYFAQHMFNCCLINLEDMLQNGTVISGTRIDRPKSFSTACNIATQIIAQVASCQYGGQSISLAHLAPFVEVSRRKIREEVAEELSTEFNFNGSCEEIQETVNRIAESRLYLEIEKGIQTLQYQIITLMTTNGQAPFITVFAYLNEVDDPQTKDDLAMIIKETFRQRIKGVKNEKGVYITPAFPKLIYVLQEDNIDEGTPYFYLTELAARCTAKRMVPDYISEKVMKQLKIDPNGDPQVYSCMGCRSFLTPYVDADRKPKYYGRFNQGVVTINLVDIALSSEGDMERFWDIFEERTEMCHRALMLRHERLKGTPSDISPIHWQHGALARLKPGEKIDDLLYGGYSTISLGYAGLWEAVYYLTGCPMTDPEGEIVGELIMEALNKKTAQWKAEHHIDFSLYGTPMESVTYKFAKRLQERFGVIPHVTDKAYITNSYHVHVTQSIDAFNKLTFEAKFQKLSPGGAISYVEVPNMENNIPAVLAVLKHIYNTIMYAELNTKSDYCQVCGYSGEIMIVDDEHGKHVFECPNCGNRDKSKMNVARRTCGYIGLNDFNQGRLEEIKERKLHL